MYSLRTQEKLDAARDQTSSREILWRNLRNKKKSGRMVCRIYDKSREEMVHSCKSRCRDWITRANNDMGNWVREPQPSVFQHTFRDRQREAELGPANGHVSARKYVPRLVLTGGGELDEEKAADLAETLLEPSRMRGNHATALQNPCRPTVVITDTAKIRGRLEHPHWEPPRYFLRPREKAQEIGPDIQYADRNDMQRIFSGVVKNSLFAWGKYEGGGPTDAPTCRQEQRSKWVGDQKFYPGFRYTDNQRETISGTKYPPDLLTAGHFTRAVDFSRDRRRDKELPQHERFRLVVRSGEYACPEGNTRRSLRFKEAPPEHYPEEKTYFASIRSVPAAASTSNMANLAANTRPRGRLSASTSARSLCGGEGGRTTQKTCPGGGVSRGGVLQSNNGDSSSSRLLSSSKSSAEVRFSPDNVQAGFPDKEGECHEVPRRTAVRGEYEEGRRTMVGQDTQRSRGCNLKVAEGMRRGSEMASWVTCGAREKSAKEYLW